MGDKVFLVEVGHNYDGSGIAAVFSTKELAEQFVKNVWVRDAEGRWYRSIDYSDKVSWHHWEYDFVNILEMELDAPST